MPHTDRNTRPDGERRRMAANLAALLVSALLLLGDWLLMRELAAASRIQDCVLSGRRTCAPVPVPAGR